MTSYFYKNTENRIDIDNPVNVDDISQYISNTDYNMFNMEATSITNNRNQIYDQLDAIRGGPNRYPHVHDSTTPSITYQPSITLSSTILNLYTEIEDIKQEISNIENKLEINTYIQNNIILITYDELLQIDSKLTGTYSFLFDTISSNILYQLSQIHTTLTEELNTLIRDDISPRQNINNKQIEVNKSQKVIDDTYNRLTTYIKNVRDNLDDELTTQENLLKSKNDQINDGTEKIRNILNDIEFLNREISNKKEQLQTATIGQEIQLNNEINDLYNQLNEYTKYYTSMNISQFNTITSQLVNQNINDHILPHTYPVGLNEIFTNENSICDLTDVNSNNLCKIENGCRQTKHGVNSEPYELTYIIENENENEKPKYGTDRVLKNIGPRLENMHSVVNMNINKTTPFDIKNSGYNNIDQSDINYNNLLLEQIQVPITKNKSTKNQSTTNQSTTNQSTTNQSTTNQSTTNQSTTNQSTTNQSTTNQSTESYIYDQHKNGKILINPTQFLSELNMQPNNTYNQMLHTDYNLEPSVYCDDKNCITRENSDEQVTLYNTLYNTYNENCGSKYKMGNGSIIESLPNKRHVIEALKSNIIGSENSEIPMLYMRNIAKYNNNDLIDGHKQNYSLNNLKTHAHSNFINNTNSQRTEYKTNLVNNTDKMKTNLVNRG